MYVDVVTNQKEFWTKDFVDIQVMQMNRKMHEIIAGSKNRISTSLLNRSIYNTGVHG
jgi:histidinol phosphatase-like enzyme